MAHGDNSTKPIVILGDTLRIRGEYDVVGSALQAKRQASGFLTVTYVGCVATWLLVVETMCFK